MKNIAVFDVDGVLADYEGQIALCVKDVFDIPFASQKRNLYRLEDRYSGEVLEFVQELTNDPSFYYPLPECRGAVDFATRLYGDGYGIMFVSSRPKASEYMTQKWINKHLCVSAPFVECGVSDKPEFLAMYKDQIDFVVEDNPQNIQDLSYSGFQTLCWWQEWNEGIFPRVYVRGDGILMLWEDESIEAQPFFEEN